MQEQINKQVQSAIAPLSVILNELKQDIRSHIELENERIENIDAQLEATIVRKMNEATWKILGIIAIPLIAFAVAWGSLYTQVSNNKDTIDKKVLTTSDKENLENQISAVAASIEFIRSDIKDIKTSLK